MVSCAWKRWLPSSSKNAYDRSKEKLPVIAIALCLLAFVTVFWAGKRSVALGIVAALTFGYFYGIVRANLLSTATYFIFDSALIGLYASQKWTGSNNLSNSSALRGWLLLLMLWPVLLVMLPFQPLLVSLVGLRGAIFFIPMAWLGSRLRGREVYLVSLGLAALNLAALAFATAEYVRGVQFFYPVNAVTSIIYESSDVAGGFYRIPATFVNAHSYGGMMVSTIPYLVGTWDQAKTRAVRLFAVIGTAAALLGVLMSATRINFVISAVLVLVAIWNGRMKVSRRAVFVLLIVGMMSVALNNARFQRFKSLSDTGYVEDRISGSVNRGFLDILIQYPFGNGLGGGGTNMPYFLQGQVKNPIAMENEYARILSEQGIIGLLLWVGFLGWFLCRTPIVLAVGPWATSRRLIWGLSVIGLISGLLGLGMLTAIPETAMFLLGIGFISTPMTSEAPQNRPVGVSRAVLPQQEYAR
jgi:hypothetical protein